MSSIFDFREQIGLPLGPFAMPHLSTTDLQTPGEKHYDLSSDPFDATTPMPPKSITGMENSPSNSRGNAHSPETLDELTHQVSLDDESSASQNSLDRYREMDLAPIDTVVESKSAGDLILSGTPFKCRDIFSPCSVSGPGSHPGFAESLEYEARWIKEQFVKPCTSLSRPRGKGDLLSIQQPTIITVMEMLPEVMFWTGVASIMCFGKMVYGAVFEEFVDMMA